MPPHAKKVYSLADRWPMMKIPLCTTPKHIADYSQPIFFPLRPGGSACAPDVHPSITRLKI
eukprot:172739-Pleurochrysis_carterae.AAC.2